MMWAEKNFAGWDIKSTRFLEILQPKTNASSNMHIIPKTFHRYQGSHAHPSITEKRVIELSNLFPRLLPVLFATFPENREISYHIASGLQSIDFLERLFPCNPANFKSLCETFGYPCDDTRLTVYVEAQKEWFARKVPAGEHLDYQDDERCPYDCPTAISDIILGQRYQVRAFRSKRVNYCESFWDERRIISKIHHPHVHEFCGSFSQHDYADYFFLYAPYDQTLHQYLTSYRQEINSVSPFASHQPVGFVSFVTWMVDLLSALTYFHSLGVLHKHIDSHNILLRNSVIYLSGLNFYGEDVEIVPGSPYHAPEIYRSPATRRADIYSLGRVFLDFMFCYFRIEPPVNDSELRKYESKELHDGFLGTCSDILHSAGCPSHHPLSQVLQLVLRKMMDWSPGQRSSAILLKQKLSSVLKEIPDVGDRIIEEMTLKYPDMSKESVDLRFWIMQSNMERREGAVILDQILEDLLEGAEELAFDAHGSLDNLTKSGRYGRCIFVDQEERLDVGTCETSL